MSLVTDGKPIVAAIKADLERRGVALTTPCGAFEITKRVAWHFRDTGAGLHAKPSGENCDGFSVDVVIWPDGQFVDCLINSQTENVPAWQIKQGDPEFWRPPFDPGDVAAPAPNPGEPPAPRPPAPPDDPLVELLRECLPVAEALVDAAGVLIHSIAALETRLEQIEQHGVRVHL